MADVEERDRRKKKKGDCLVLSNAYLFSNFAARSEEKNYRATIGRRRGGGEEKKKGEA